MEMDSNFYTFSPPLFVFWFSDIQFSSVQSLSHFWLFATPWIAVHRASLSITNSRSSLKLTSIESVMPSSHLILCRPLLLLPPIPPSIRIFPMSQLFTWSGQSTGISALASFLPKNTQDQSPLEWTGWISFQFSSVHSVMSDSLWPHESQHARPPCPSPTPGVHSNSCPSSQWCHTTISSSVVPFSPCPNPS